MKIKETDWVMQRNATDGAASQAAGAQFVTTDADTASQAAGHLRGFSPRDKWWCGPVWNAQK